MNIINIHEAKTHLSKLVEQAARGESFIIAKAGKPMVKVVAMDAPTGKKIKRRGFLAGQIKVPENFDAMFQQEIEEMFYGKK
jgi:prevent-host-death family protein